ncbi:MAG: RIP metalloprotease RseP [Rubrivivax sp.]
MLTTVLAFLATIALLVVVHEYGHYRAAVACGVKVLRFSVGFGRVVWSRRFGADRCEFTLCMLPLGGYVRMLDERESAVDPAERARAFNRKSLRQRAFIVSAGPAANLLLAVVLYASAHLVGIQEPKAVFGQPPAASVADQAGLRAGDWAQAWSTDGQAWQELRSMTDLRWAVMQALLDGRDLHLQVADTEGQHRRRLLLALQAEQGEEVDAASMRRLGLAVPYSPPVIGDVMPGGPAAMSGLLPGDLVLAVDGRPVLDAAGLRETIRNHAGTPMNWHVERAQSALRLVVTPRPVVLDGQNRPSGRIDAIVGLPAEMVVVRSGPVEALVGGVQRTWDVSVLTLRMIGRMIVGEASLSNLSGPLTIADFAGQSVERGWSHYLAFLALVSVSLGVLNLLPLPMLDGGHLMYYLFEAVSGRPVPDEWLEKLQRGGIALLFMMMSLALFNDFSRLLGLH